MMLDGQKVQLRKGISLDPFAEDWISTDRSHFPLPPDFLNRQEKTHPDERTGWLAIVEKQSNLVVGRAGLLFRSDVFQPGELELAYVVREEHQKKGFAKEAAGLLLDYVKGSDGIRRVFLGIAPDNAASIRIAESIGLKQEYTKSHFGMPHFYYWYRKPGAWKPEQFADEQG